MWRIETRRQLDDVEFDTVGRLLADAADFDGYRPLSDHLWLQLVDRSAGFAAALAFDRTDSLAAYAQLARANRSTAIEVVIAPDERARTDVLAPQLLRAALAMVGEAGGGSVNWWVHRADQRADVIAAEVGLQLSRRLFQMRRTLPIAETTDVVTRAFVIGRDEDAWLRVNNAAFEGHPEQGGWTLDTLRQRQGEPWFDPQGFLLHERDGVLAAFCWTKVHKDTAPPMGEIYVIGVDPAFQGLGLGKALTIAGLSHLAEQGLTVGMLHVDGANAVAMALYERLGFAIHHTDHAYVGAVDAAHQR